MNDELKTTRDGFGEGLLQAGKDNDQVVVVNADLEESTRVHLFKKEFPNRFFQAGVAEQNMMGISAGLALGGKIPFATSFAIFSPGLNWEQIRIATISKLNIKIASTHAGLSNGPDGVTHQALEDIAMMRVLPDMTVVVPSDFNQAKLATQLIAQVKGPCYLRLSKTPTPILKTDQPFEIGKAQIIKTGTDLTIIATGNMIHQAVEATSQLEEQGLSVGLINMHTIKPLDKKAILNAAQNSKDIVTIEEHQIAGGLGSVISEYLSSAHPIRIVRIGIKDRFGQSGTIEELYAEYNLDVASIVKKISQSINEEII
ncbi:MAG: transketolase family protein [Candidatus Pacebacteria bacterium]|nr:transketolase family protein [Candidatus Paceibacterota bacterium]